MAHLARHLPKQHHLMARIERVALLQVRFHARQGAEESVHCVDSFRRVVIAGTAERWAVCEAMDTVPTGHSAWLAVGFRISPVLRVCVVQTRTIDVLRQRR